MTRVGTRALIDASRTAGIGTAALNVIQIEHAEAIVEGAERVGAPVILQLSENAVRYHGALEPIAAACRNVAEQASVPVALHLDHATTAELCHRAADAGFDSVMIDASAAPWSENVAITAEIAVWGHDRGLWIEAEIGEVGGKGAHVTGARTDPVQAERFVEQTGVDGLAIAIGSSHAMRTRDATLDLDLLARIRARVAVPLVLHGSSGVSDAGIAEAIDAGITKVNVATQLNIAFTGAVRTLLTDDAGLVDPRTYLGAGRDAVARRAAELITTINRTHAQQEEKVGIA
ncbi:class II fructose-bisphosphate aldolase [Agromyces sp. Marseille-P2726]|uniref:class II fructose-bisphosphate aldolase n=1 Tax=Agromyces sp. Marseille-P2726 TaxID=2709132 RepID=UPI00156F14FF|nr:class II fructose-bisphosphate aldolase [Agromyces sp. Marseille-P2726]